MAAGKVAWAIFKVTATTARVYLTNALEREITAYVTNISKGKAMFLQQISAPGVLNSRTASR